MASVAVIATSREGQRKAELSIYKVAGPNQGDESLAKLIEKPLHQREKGLAGERLMQQRIPTVV